MESSTTLLGVSFKKKPRSGQKRVLEALKVHREHLNVKLPTGYGKTYGACCVYSILQLQARATRLLYIVANTTQLNQFTSDAHKDLADACVQGPVKIMDVSFYPLSKLLRAHRGGECQVFVITIQSLREPTGFERVTSLLQTGQWMVCIDEYHHYGITKSWGVTALRLVRAFLLCMSATPSRPGDDSAFGEPHVSVLYREAEKEKAVKSLRGHAYNYRVDLELDGETITCTTSDLIDMVGSDAPDKIERFRIERKMRWSPDYISPLVAHPIERMMGERVETGYKLQALVGAMCVSHAKLVCEQIRTMYPELVVEWVGTGEHGRSDAENARILAEFCPAKDEMGIRPPGSIDVLVHVGMAGEGLDSVYVSEIVFLSAASLTNKNLQIIGRAARYLVGVVAHINFDSSSELAEKYVGAAIMDAMDYRDPTDDDDDDDDGDGDVDYQPLPDEPTIRIYSMELIEIDSGHDGVQRMARVLREHDPKAFDYQAMFADQNHPHWTDLIRLYRGARAVEASEFNEKSAISQLRNDVDAAVIKVTGLVIRKLGQGNEPIHRSLAGRIKTEINGRKKRLHGEVCNDQAVLRRHYAWLKQLERDILEKGTPEWLTRPSR